MFDYNVFTKRMSNKKLKKESFIKNEVADRLLQRLNFIKIKPQKIYLDGYIDSKYLAIVTNRFPTSEICCNEIISVNYKHSFDLIISKPQLIHQGQL